MTYATKTDIDDLYGTELLIKTADKNKNGIPDPETVDRALRSADGIINGYLEGQYTLPIQGTSDLLKEIAIDLAVYKIVLPRGVRTTEMRVRYDDALALLDKIASKKIGLGLTPVPGGEGDPVTPPTKATMSGRSIDTYRK